jgi:hypothetical protein
VAVRHAGPIRALPGLATQAAAAESAPSLRGPITLGATRAGVRRAGNPPAAYDVAGGRRQQRLPGPTATAPALDPTCERLGGDSPGLLTMRRSIR